MGRKYTCAHMETRPKHPGIDLIIADAPSNLPVPVISPTECPKWNVREEEYFENLFCFAAAHITDVGCILLMHPKDRKIERLLDARALVYGLRVVRDWWGYNPLPMASPLPHQKQVNCNFNIYSSIYKISFKIFNYNALLFDLQTHNFNIKVFARKSMGAKFKTRELTEEYAGVKIVPDDADDLYNFTDLASQLKRPNGQPWRGCREKDPSFIQCFVDCLTDEGGIVMDWSASTGSYST